MSINKQDRNDNFFFFWGTKKKKITEMMMIVSLVTCMHFQNQLTM